MRGLLTQRTKGQASLEMVANYAWAVLVVAAVAVALWRFGAFESPQVIEKSKQGFSGVEVLDFKFLSDSGNPNEGFVTGTLTTTYSRSIRIRNITGKIINDPCTLGIDCNNNGWEIGDEAFTTIGLGMCTSSNPDECPTIAVGDSFTFLLGPVNDVSGGPWPNPDSADTVSVHVEIDYRDAEFGLNHTSTGELTAPVTGYI